MNGLYVKNLNKAFGGIIVAKDINFTLEPGARKALIGPNGAGKSTFANLITGILKPDSGEITFNGKDIRNLTEAQRVKAGIGKTFQITTLFSQMTVRENLRLPILERENRALSWIKPADSDPVVEQEIVDLLAQFGLSDMADLQVNELAYGQQRLVELALTLALKPSVLILDEPAAGVPSSESHLILDAIARLPEDLAVLIIEHDMNLVFQFAKEIIVLVNGVILTEGTPDEISRDEKVRELYLGGAHE